MSAHTLYVYYESFLVGTLLRNEDLVSSFTYSEEWLKNSKRFQLSLAMPLQKEAFGNKVTLSFFENLLPEGNVRDALEKSHHLEGVYEFLGEFGKDCAGAIILSTESQSPYKESSNKNDIAIDMKKIYQAIDQKKSVAEVMAQKNPGYLSIAGAQDKFAAIYKEEKFFLPTDGRPTTHIVKVPIHRSGVKESVYNEYYCMKLARLVGLNVADCFVLDHNEHPIYVTTRYDRIIDKKGVAHRLHQQDFCQAQGVVSENKYEVKGGPTLKTNYELIKFHVAIKKRSASLFSFLDWICFNLLIGNNDSHSKNISLLLKEKDTELAPFYDLMCTAIYSGLKRNFSFKVGDRDDASRIGKNQFEMLDRELGLKIGTMNEQMLLMREKLLKHKDVLADEIKIECPKAKIVKRIATLIGDRCRSLDRQGL